MTVVNTKQCVAVDTHRAGAEEAAGAGDARVLDVVLGVRHDERAWVIHCYIDDPGDADGGLRDALVSGCVLSLVQVEEHDRTSRSTAVATDAAVRAEMQRRLERLSRAERKVLDRLADGLTNRQIADELFLAHKTVKNYVSSVLCKLDMSRRTEAAVFAARLRDYGAVTGVDVTRATVNRGRRELKAVHDEPALRSDIPGNGECGSAHGVLRPYGLVAPQ